MTLIVKIDKLLENMKKILIIDDDPQYIDIIGFKLKNSGFDIDTAHSADIAIDLSVKNNYSLIILDVFFPNKDDGLNVLKQLKRNSITNNIPVILATSQPAEVFIQEENFADYLSMVKEFISKDSINESIVQKVTEILKN